MTLDNFLPPTEAGRVLGISASQVRHLALQGRLREFRDGANRRLFKRADVERLRDQREAQRAQGAQPAGARP